MLGVTSAQVNRNIEILMPIASDVWGGWRLIFFKYCLKGALNGASHEGELLGRSVPAFNKPAQPRRSNPLRPNKQSYCLSETTTLWIACPSASLPLKVEVRVFPSLETVEVTVIVTWPPFFIVDSIVLASIRFTETVSA